MSYLATLRPLLFPRAIPLRTFSTSPARRVTDPRILDADTLSGASVKADKHNKDPLTLQREHTRSANNPSSHSHNEAAGKVTASPNENPTQSEDAVHADKHRKSPEQLQKETASKLHRS
ncbi:hypothetical protein ACQY0O_003751 [Thecaphora frezii]